MSIKGFKINGNIEKYDYESLDNKPDIVSDGITESLKNTLKEYFTNVQTLLPQIAYVTEENAGNTLIQNAKDIIKEIHASLDEALAKYSI